MRFLAFTCDHVRLFHMCFFIITCDFKVTHASLYFPHATNVDNWKTYSEYQVNILHMCFLKHTCVLGIFTCVIILTHATKKFLKHMRIRKFACDCVPFHMRSFTDACAKIFSHVNNFEPCKTRDFSTIQEPEFVTCVFQKTHPCKNFHMRTFFLHMWNGLGFCKSDHGAKYSNHMRNKKFTCVNIFSHVKN